MVPVAAAPAGLLTASSTIPKRRQRRVAGRLRDVLDEQGVADRSQNVMVIAWVSTVHRSIPLSASPFDISR